MKVLITGSSGFIGKHLVSYLKIQDRVKVIEYDKRQGYDIFDNWSLLMAMREADLVIHLAGATALPVSFQTPFDYYRINVEGTARVFSAASKYKLKVIHASTGEVNTKNSPYAASKIGAEAVADCENINGGNIVCVRLLNPYGPGQPGSYVIPHFLTLARAGKDLVINGTGEQRKDYVYVSDLVSAIWAARKLDRQKVDIGMGKTTSINEIAKIVKGLYPKTQVKHNLENARKGEVLDLKGDIQPLLDIGWKPEVSIYSGIKKVKEVIENV